MREEGFGELLGGGATAMEDYQGCLVSLRGWEGNRGRVEWRFRC